MRLLNQLLLEAQKDFDLFNHFILFGYMGSISHGTYKANYIDDKDVMGIIIPPKEYTFGLKTFGSRNTKTIQKEYWDIVIYTFNKLAYLLTKNNPNVLNLLWLPEDLYIRKTKCGQMLIDNRDLFSSKLAYKSFGGYANAQLQKLKKKEYKGYMGRQRKELVDKIGYDGKHASHLYRLLEEGIEFLETGKIIVQRNNADILLQIKNGQWKLEKIKQKANVLFEKLKEANRKSTLPEEPNYGKINELIINIYEEFYYEKR